jgi:hypothetical protein
MSQKTLDKLYAKATAAATAPSGKAPVRPTIALAEEDLAVVGDMICAHALAKDVTEELDALKAQAGEAVFAAFTQKWFDEQAKPANPRLAVRDARGDHDTIYQMRDTPGLGGHSTRESMVAALAAGDDGLALANELVDTEIVRDPGLRMRYSLSELAKGHVERTANGSQFVEPSAEELAMAEKILDFLMHAPDKKGKVSVRGLTAEERAFLLVREEGIKFKDPKGFFTRLVSYVTTLPQLRRVLTVFAPVQMFSPMHFAVGAEDEDRQRRLLDVAEAVLDA